MRSAGQAVACSTITSGEALRAERVGGDPRGDRALASRGQDPLAALTELRQDGVQVGGARFETGREDQLVEDMEKPDGTAAQAGDGDGFLQSSLGRRAAIDRNQDSLIHGSSLKGREPPVWRCRFGAA